jgi:hypothetical protein
MKAKLQWHYTPPLRVSVVSALDIAEKFLKGAKGRTRLLVLCGALFEALGTQSGRFARVVRGKFPNRYALRPNTVDLECLDADGNVAIAVEIKDRELTLADFEGAISKARNREIREVFFTAPRIAARDAAQISERISTAFAGGQNFYVFDLFDLARPVLALGGEQLRVAFLKKVGEHLDNWNTQPSHRQAWKRILESL